MPLARGASRRAFVAALNETPHETQEPSNGPAELEHSTRQRQSLPEEGRDHGVVEETPPHTHGDIRHGNMRHGDDHGENDDDTRGGEGSGG